MDNIYTGGAEQDPSENPRQSRTWDLLSLTPNEALSFPSLGLWVVVLTFLLLLLHAKTYLSFVAVVIFFPGEGVASQIHLPAGDTVHHPGVSVHTGILFSVATHWPHKLRIRFRPLVKVHVRCPHRNTWVTCIVEALWYANWGHVLLLLLWGVWVGINWEKLKEKEEKT